MPSIPPTRRVLDFLTKATGGGTEATIEQLFEIFELPAEEATLTRVMWAAELLEGLGLTLRPDLKKGGLDSVRRVLPKERCIDADTVLSEIERWESSNLELKSSLMYNHGRAASNSTTPIADLRSDEVIHSALKSVAAFLNSAGGVLYIGIADDRRKVGIEFDFKLLNADRQNEDGWELQFRNLVKGNFKDGDNINDYIRIDFLKLDSVCVCRVEVGPRSRLAFLKFKGSYHLFRRQGNRTEEVTIEQVEEFLALRSSPAQGGLS